MKLIKCNTCGDVVRLVHTEWRKCECGKSGGQYNDDMISATIGGDCEVIGLRNDFFKEKPFSNKRSEDGKNAIIQGEYLGDNQIHRIKSSDGPKLKMDIEKVDDDKNKITFTDKRKYTINLKGEKSPKTIEVPANKEPSFKAVKEEYIIKESIKDQLLFERKRRKKKKKRDACYYKVKSRYDVWPSAYASGALSKCRKVGADNWGNSTNESEDKVNTTFVKDFLIDFGTLISLNFSQITKMGVDGDATKELTLMMQQLRKPIINGQTYFDFLKDNMNTISNNPKLLSTLLGIVRDFLIYIEPRVNRFVTDGTIKDGWLDRINKIKEDYKKIINSSVNETVIDEKWSKEYKDSIDCNNPKGFSQRAHCQGRKKNEEVFNIDELITEKRKLTSKPGSESNLRDWFKRKGAKGSTGGWVDCNTCRKDKETGRTKCKPCGRKEGEKRSKYPACRPTAGSCKKYKKSTGKSWGKKAMSEGLDYHLEHNIPLTENIYRYGSESYFKLINEVRSLYNKGELELSETEQELISTDIGKRAVYEGRVVWLDILYEEGVEVSILTEAKYKGKNVPLNKPKRGGSKKFYVYTKNDKGNVIKVSFGAKSGGGKLAVKLKDPKARKAFADRHNCEQKNDKTKAGYWACRLPRYAKSLGLSGGGKWW
jgi:hypothetical protein